MRLTLRTLLAYLDDTLDPSEIKEIGQKVAESDAAQELVARIKQVTRRRRLTTPSPADAKFDANTIAEYLDNELSGELVADLEKTCLESDVHLAEVASCHQILTLVLGEPALVPPTARERMYGLVKGREAIPFRKARLRDGAEGGDEDSLLPDLPSSRGWLLWALPVAAVLVLAVLAVAVVQALPEARPAPVVAVKPPPSPTDTAQTPPTPQPPADTAAPPPADTGAKPTPPVTSTPADTPTPPAEAPKPPSTAHVAVGAFAPLPPGATIPILVERQARQQSWKRLLAGGNSQVFSTDDLASLPGYNSELALGPDGGTHLVLHGHVPQFTVHPFEGMNFLMDSAVRLYQPDAGFDADLTLQHGRIYLSNHKANGPAKVRLRFGGDATRTPTPPEVWDLTLLAPDTEIGIDFMQGYTGDIDYRNGVPPLQNLYLFLLAGSAGMKIGSQEYFNLPAPVAVLWDNRSAAVPVPQPVDPKVMPSLQAVWNQAPPAGGTQPERDAIANMRAALSDLSVRMSEKKAVDATLLEARHVEDQPMLRLLAVYSFGAIDGVDRLLDVLCTDEDPAHAPDRDAAIFALRRWIARSSDNGLLLYDETKQTGLLPGRYHFPGTKADTILMLLHDFSLEDARKEGTFSLLTGLLRDSHLPIRELAYWQLRHLSAGVKGALPDYNAAWGEEQRDAAALAWKALVGKELPPR